MENVQNVPIDIQTSKLLDWLIDRRHCNLKWQNAVKEIREKINVAMQDMPENEEIKQFLSGSYIHYFHCLRIVEILKGTEESSKNIFGKYSSQRMKDWQEVVRLYQADNIYLAEVASLLIRSVSYEGPVLRKQLAKAKQLQQDMSRREVECQSSAANLQEHYYAACKKYGIKGDNIPRELQALVKELPDVLNQVGTDAARLEEKIQLYTAFTNFVCEWSEPVLPMLTFAQKRGNATFYEWRTGKVPAVMERPLVEDTPVEAPAEDTIDWGDFGTQEPSSEITVEDGIDWGISVEPSPEDGGSGDAIDWGDADVAPAEIAVVQAGTDCPDGVAKGNDALSVLENAQSRGQFVDELMELEAFLRQRLTEMGQESDVVAMSQFQSAPRVIQIQSTQHIRGMLSEVQDLLGRLTSLQMQHLFMILASPRYVERVTEVLRQKMKQADILELKAISMVEKRREALEEQSRLEPRVDLLAERTQELKKMIETDISKRYNNRPVNLMGVVI
ncbi:CDK5 regulatory subunit-associated protein 3 isoform X2 [Vanacampus margaritifer]